MWDSHNQFQHLQIETQHFASLQKNVCRTPVLIGMHQESFLNLNPRRKVKSSVGLDSSESGWFFFCLFFCVCVLFICFLMFICFPYEPQKLAASHLQVVMPLPPQ